MFIGEEISISKRNRQIYDSAMRSIGNILKPIGYRSGPYYEYLCGDHITAEFLFYRASLEQRLQIISILIRALREIRETPLPSVITVRGEEVDLAPYIEACEKLPERSLEEVFLPSSVSLVFNE